MEAICAFFINHVLHNCFSILLSIFFNFYSVIFVPLAFSSTHLLTVGTGSYAPVTSFLSSILNKDV